MKYKCILFDCDGVLVDSVEISYRVIKEMTAPLGIEIDALNIREAFAGGSIQGIFRLIEEESHKYLPPDFENEYRQKTFDLFKRELKPIEGIKDLLTNLTVPCCVASGGPLTKIMLNLQLTGLYEFFEGNIFSSYEINSWKPEPAIFLHAASVMGFEPSECAVIEDSMAGIEAAVAGGFDVYGFTSGGNEIKMRAKGAIPFWNIKELQKLIL